MSDVDASKSEETPSAADSAPPSDAPDNATASIDANSDLTEEDMSSGAEGGDLDDEDLEGDESAGEGDAVENFDSALGRYARKLFVFLSAIITQGSFVGTLYVHS